MVIQYKHTGIAYLAGNSVKDVNGNWPEIVKDVFLTTMCRAEPVGSKGYSAYVTGIGGEQIVYSCVVYMPIPQVVIKPGMLFEVWDGERLIVRESVKLFSKGQLNARVWL